MIVKKAEYIKEYKIKLIFSDGTTKVVDFEPFLTSSKEIIVPLFDKEYFKSFFVDEITICWPNGLDFSPELLHKIGKEVKETKNLSLKIRKTSLRQPVPAFSKRRSKKIK